MGLAAESSMLCQFQAVSGPARSLLLPSIREDHSAFLTLWAASNKLSSKRPMYVVLARTATRTMAWMGWDEAILESVWRKGVVLRFNQEGAAAFEAGCSPRNRDGRRLDIIVVGSVRDRRGYRRPADIGRGTALSKNLDGGVSSLDRARACKINAEVGPGSFNPRHIHGLTVATTTDASSLSREPST